MKGDMRYEVNEDWHVILYKRSMILDSIVLTSRTGEKDLAPLPLLLDDDDTTDPIVRMQTRRWAYIMARSCNHGNTLGNLAHIDSVRKVTDLSTTHHSLTICGGGCLSAK